MLALTRTRLFVAAALFLTATANWAFFAHLTQVYPLATNPGFVVSVAVVLFSALLLALIVVGTLVPARALVGAMLVLASVTGYFSDHFGTVVDEDMLRNVLATDPGEVADLLTPGFVLRVLLLGVLPAVALGRLPLRRARWPTELRHTAQTALVALGLVLANGFAFSDYYVSFLREHKPLRYYTNPSYPLYSAGKLAAAALRADGPDGLQMLAAHARTPPADPGRELVVVVVGETARADHFSLNGYARDTNPALAAQDQLVSYTHISSCGTSTAVSVPCLFAFATRADFDAAASRHSENALDVLRKAGVNVLWRDNNSDSKGVAERVTYEDFRGSERNPVCDVECRDVGMLTGLQDYIDSRTHGDILIVLHQMGSHGPAYFKRYPPAFEAFRPACHSAELSQCTRQEIVNAYDNTVLYTDHFLSRVIELLEANTPRFETAMFYVSDHGESLGENGLYLHGLPYLLAPEAQTRVALIAWVGASSDIDYQSALAMRDTPNTHDAFAPSLLQMFEVEADLLAEPPSGPLLFRLKPDNDDR